MSNIISELQRSVQWSYPQVHFSGGITSLHEAAIAVNITFPDEVAPLGTLGVDPVDIRSAKLLRTTLDKDFKYGDDKSVGTAEYVSRALGGIITSRLGTELNDNPPFTFGHGTIGFDDIMIGIEDPQMVIDHGAGLNGLLSHRTLFRRNPDYTLVASAKDDVQAYALEGIGRGLTFPSDSLITFPGADEASETILDEFGEGSVDIVLMSRIHAMNKKAMKSIVDTTPQLLKPGGLVIVRSPELFSVGFSASKQAQALLEDPSMKLEKQYNYTQTSGDPNPQQAFLIRKVA